VECFRGAWCLFHNEFPPLLEGRGGKGKRQEIASFLRWLICNDWRGIMAKNEGASLILVNNIKEESDA